MTAENGRRAAQDVPLIGVTTYREQAQWGAWHATADLLAGDYARHIEAAGGAPVLLPPQRAEAAYAVVSRLDALVLSGGADVDPARYHQRPGAWTTAWRPDRDTWEFALLDAAAARDLPVLGVCRGLQVLAVWAGGTLCQHVPDRVGHEGHRPGPGRFGPVTVRVQPGTVLHGLLGAQVVSACHHHQCVADHPGLVLSAWATDGVPEAIEDPARRFWVGVQWHPEAAADLALFRALVGAATG